MNIFKITKIALVNVDMLHTVHMLVQVVDMVDILIGFSSCPNLILFFSFGGKKLAKFLNLYNIFIFPQNQLLATIDINISNILILIQILKMY